MCKPIKYHDIDTENFLEFISELYDKAEHKEEFMNGISDKFSGTKQYIHDWTMKARNETILKIYNDFKDEDLSLAKKCLKIHAEILSRQLKGQINFFSITPKAIRHIVENNR